MDEPELETAPPIIGIQVQLSPIYMTPNGESLGEPIAAEVFDIPGPEWRYIVAVDTMFEMSQGLWPAPKKVFSGPEFNFAPGERRDSAKGGNLNE